MPGITESHNPAAEAANRWQDSLAHGGILKILYVEDNATLREPVQEWFNLTGHHMLVAADATAGYDLACAELPDVILIDLMLGELDGLSLAFALGEVPELAQSLRLAVTAADHKAMIKPALAAGCVGYIFKPFSPSELYDSLIRYINGRRDSLTDAEMVGILRQSAARLVSDLKAKIVQRDTQFAELQTAHATLQVTQEHLIRTERLIATGQLGLRMAHELNNPLQAVQNSLELIRESLQPELAKNGQMQRFLDIGLQEVKRASTLARSLLDVHTPHAQQQSTVDWLDVIEDVVMLIRTAAERATIRIEMPTVHGVYLSPGGYADMHQVIRNLAQNAIDAMRKNGTLRINVTHRQNETGDWVQIDVSDTGPGLAPEVMAHLSELFFTTHSDGHGIGLYVCNLIVQANKGQLSWRNNSDRGATFQLLWPKYSV